MRQLLGHPDAGARSRAAAARGRPGRWRRRRPSGGGGPGMPASRGAGLATLGDGQGRGLDQVEVVVGPAGGGPGLAGALRAGRATWPRWAGRRRTRPGCGRGRAGARPRAGRRGRRRRRPSRRTGRRGCGRRPRPGVPRRATSSSVRRVGVDRGDQDALHPLLLEQGRGGRRSRSAEFAAVAEHQRQAGRLGRARRCRAATSVKNGLRGVEHHVGEGAAAAGPQLPRRLVAHEAEVGHRPLHPLAGLGADPVRPVEHVGDGAEGDPGRARRRP